jgi:hypothetical protein
MFRDSTRPPQDAPRALAQGIVSALADMPGVRLGQGPTGRRVFRGGGMNFQRFVHGPGDVNSKQIVEGTPRINARRSVGKSRGRP